MSGRERRGLRGDDLDVIRRRLRDDFFDARVRDEAALADHDQMIGREGHLAHQVARDEHGATLGGEGTQQPADPLDPFRVEPVHRFVEQQHLGVSEQRGGNTETLAHAERERAGPLPRNGADTDLFKDLVDASGLIPFD